MSDGETDAKGGKLGRQQLSSAHRLSAHCMSTKRKVKGQAQLSDLKAPDIKPNHLQGSELVLPRQKSAVPQQLIMSRATVNVNSQAPDYDKHKMYELRPHLLLEVVERVA